MTPALETLVLEAGRALAPLEERLRGGEVRLLFAEIGMPSPDELLAAQEVNDAVDDAADALGRLPDALGALAEAVEEGDPILVATAVGAAAPLVQAVATAVDVLAARIEAVAQSAGPDRAEVEAFAAELAERLFGFALAGYLDVHGPVVGHLFTLLGVIEVVPVAATAAAPAHTRRSLRLDRLSRLIDDPVAVRRPSCTAGEARVRMGAAAATAVGLPRPGHRLFVRSARAAAVPANRSRRHRAHRRRGTRKYRPCCGCRPRRTSTWSFRWERPPP